MSKISNRNRTLSVFEAVATYFVVFIHCTFPGETGIFIRSMGKFAVPLFFVVSGFFYYKENHIYNETKSTKRKIFNLIKILIASELVYAIFYDLLYVRKYGVSINSIIDGIIFSVKGYNLQGLIVNAPIFNFVGWFIVELILVYCIYYFISKYCRNYNVLYLIMFVLMFIGITLFLILDYCGFNTAYYRLSLPFMGLPYFTFGHFLNYNKDKLLKLNTPLLFISSVLLFVIEYLIYGFKDNYYSVIIFIIFVFALSIKKSNYIPKNLVLKLMDNVGSKYTTFIYIMHPLIGGLIGNIAKIFISDKFEASYKWCYPIIVAIVSTICSVIFYKGKALFQKNQSRS